MLSKLYNDLMLVIFSFWRELVLQQKNWRRKGLISHCGSSLKITTQTFEFLGSMLYLLLHEKYLPDSQVTLSSFCGALSCWSFYFTRQIWHFFFPFFLFSFLLTELTIIFIMIFRAGEKINLVDHLRSWRQRKSLLVLIKRGWGKEKMQVVCASYGRNDDQVLECGIL